MIVLIDAGLGGGSGTPLPHLFVYASVYFLYKKHRRSCTH